MPKEQYLLVKQTPCSHCNGKGDLRTPLWEGLENWSRQLEAFIPLDELSSIEDRYWKHHGFMTFDDIPKQTHQPCPHCKGTGVVEERVPITELFNQKTINTEQ